MLLNAPQTVQEKDVQVLRVTAGSGKWNCKQVYILLAQGFLAIQNS